MKFLKIVAPLSVLILIGAGCTNNNIVKEQKKQIDTLKIQLCESKAREFSKNKREEVFAELNKKMDSYSVCKNEASPGACTMKLVEANILKANSLESDYYNTSYQECLLQ